MAHVCPITGEQLLWRGRRAMKPKSKNVEIPEWASVKDWAALEEDLLDQLEELSLGLLVHLWYEVDRQEKIDAFFSELV